MGSLVLHRHDDLTTHPPSQDTFEREMGHPSDDPGHGDDLGSLVALCRLTGFCSGLVVKDLPADAGDAGDGFDSWVGNIPWRRRWQLTPVCLPGDSQGRGAWQATVHGVAKSWTQLKRLSTALG